MESPTVFSITVYGMAIAISFLVAALIKGVVVLLPRLRRPDAAEIRPTTGPAAASIPPEHVAAIAATVAAMLEPLHIVHIEDRGQATNWRTEGRMLHQTSHAVGHTPKR